MSHAWSPDQYLKYAGQRLRPAIDLLQRVDVDNPATIYDLGCGPGNTAKLLNARWPGARIVGVDNSAEMLAQAKAEQPDLSWVQADLATWTPEEPAEAMFCNAVLQWLNDHQTLVPRLAGLLKPGGVLAIQMPHNHSWPSHTCMTEAIMAGPWAKRLKPIQRVRPVAEMTEYRAMLAPVVSRLDIWETVYLQVMEGDNPVAEWTKGSALKPLLDALHDDGERAEFFEIYSKLVQKAYPKDSDGKTPFPFRRLFIVARR